MLRFRTLERVLDDPSVLFARRAVATLAGLVLCAIGVAMTLSLASWTVSDPSLTHATSAPVRNLMGTTGAAFADPAMQIFGLAAPLLVAPFVLWGARLIADRPLGVGAGRLTAGLATLFLAPAFLSAFPVTQSWPLPLGLGGVVGEGFRQLLASGLGIASGLALGFCSGLFGLAAIACLWHACRPVRQVAPLPELGYQIRRARTAEEDDEYGLDDTDTFDEPRTRWDAFAGGALHVWLSLSSGLRRKARRATRARPLRTAMGRTEPHLDDGAEFYRARRNAPHTERDGDWHGDLHGEHYETDERYPELAEEDAAAAPGGAAEPQANRHRSDQRLLAVQLTSRGPAAKLRDALEAAFRAPTAPPPRDDASDAFGQDDEAEDDFELIEPHEVQAARGGGASVAVLYPREGGVDDDDPFAAEAARHARSVAPGARFLSRPAAPSPQRHAPPQRQRPSPLHLPAEEGYQHPPLALLAAPRVKQADTELSEEALEANARELEGVLEDFGVRGAIVHVRPGPVVTLYELEPAPGIKSSRVIGLADDIARSMAAISARVAVIPGKNAIGIELPNRRRVTVFLRELLASRDFEATKSRLPMCLGKTIGGEPVIADLAGMPHLLVAGTTGSGKSVSINTMILSLLYHHTPESCRVILIDPKMLELSVYDGIPHLLTPVVTDPKKAVSALKWAVREMEDRYLKMTKLGVRNLDGFNAKMREAVAEGEPLTRIVQTGFDKQTGEAIFEEEDFGTEPMPYIVVIVDEMADLMMVAGKDIEGAIQRLAQMARAAGIHLIMATQRPSVDVITGTIKANFPTRISFQVTSKIDSRTILGEMGAEQLLGMGDMLYMERGGKVQRVHGPFVSDDEVEDVVAHLKRQGTPDYLTGVLEDDDDGEGGAGMEGLGGLSESDDLYDRAVALVLRDRKASTSYVQRRLSIGYNRAATLIERMEREGVVSPANHAGKREILAGGGDEEAA